jgi:hypothetical protein
VDYDGLVSSLSKGQTTITVNTQDGNISATSNINITSNPVFVYKIKNRWQNTYLYDAGDRVRYSVTANGNTYLWQLEDIDGVKEIKNYSTGDYMNIENLFGYVQCTTRTPGILSSRWALEDTGDGYVRIKSESDTTSYIHIENLQNQAQYGTIGESWWSAMWFFDPIAIVTSVAELPIEKIAAIYPNPSKGDFNLSLSRFSPKEKVSITIFNLAGQVIFTKSCIVDENGSKNVKVITGDMLSSGNYCVVTKGNSSFARAKLQICK